MKRAIMGLTLAVSVTVTVAVASAFWMNAGRVQAAEPDVEAVAVLRARLAELERNLPAPELGQQMLELQIRHDRLWWAGEAGNWNLAYYMVSELGETLRGVEQTNGEAPELQPAKLSEVMPAIMDPAIRGVQAALATKDKAAFAKSFDQLSDSCNACHAQAGVQFLHIQRPRTPLLDNLRYAPDAGP